MSSSRKSRDPAGDAESALLAELGPELKTSTEELFSDLKQHVDWTQTELYDLHAIGVHVSLTDRANYGRLAEVLGVSESLVFHANYVAIAWSPQEYVGVRELLRCSKNVLSMDHLFLIAMHVARIEDPIARNTRRDSLVERVRRERLSIKALEKITMDTPSWS